jgi:hypothetical protein
MWAARRRVFWPVVVVAAVFVLVNVSAAALQPRISLNGGKGWDGVYYYATAVQLREGAPLVGLAPFAYRVGVPFLAQLTAASELIDGFLAVNVTANAVTCVALVFLLLRYTRNAWVAGACVALFILQWHGPVRFSYFYPVLTDGSVLAVLTVGWCFISAPRLGPPQFLVLSAVTVAGVAVRETALLLPAALLFRDNPISFEGRRLRVTFPRVQLLVPLCLGLVTFAVIRVWASAPSGPSFLETALKFSHEKTVLSYLHAWFIAHGPVLALLIAAAPDVARFLASNQAVFAQLSAIAVLAWFGGSDTERLLYWGMPAVFILVSAIFERHDRATRSRSFLAVLLLAQLVSERPFSPIPDPLGSPSSLFGEYQYWWSFYAGNRVNAGGLLVYAMVSAALVVGFRRVTRRERPLHAVDVTQMLVSGR